MKTKYKHSAIFGILLSVSPLAHSEIITWTGATADLGTAGNWTGTNTPPISDDALIFGAEGPGGLLLNNNLTSGAFNLAGITYDSGAGAFIIGDGTTTANTGNTFALTGNITNSSTSLQTINNPFSMTAVRTFTTSTGGGDITLGGDISGTGGGVIKAGSGSLTLTGNNSYTGNTTVNVGQLNINSATAIGAGSLSLASGTFFDNTSGGTVAIANNISGSADINFGGTNSLTTTGSLTHNNSGRTVWVNGSGVLTVGNVINATSGTGRMRKNGIGTLVVNGTGPSGGYEVYGGGTLWLAANNPSTSSNSIIVNTGTLILSGNNTSHSIIDLDPAGILQLQANVGNTTSGISSAMKPQAFSTNSLPSGSTIQLRSDTAVLFNNTAAPTTTASGDRPAGNLNFDVGKVASGSGQVLQFGQTASSFMVNRSGNNTTINVTGSDGYALQLGTILINNAGTVTLNPTTANLIVAGVTNGGALIKNGAGSLTSNGNIGSSGANIGTTVNQGTLTSKGNFFGSLAVNNANTTDPGTDTVLNLNTAADTTTGSLSGSISTPASGTNTATINNGGSGINFTVNQTAAGTYQGVIAGDGGFSLGSLSTNTLTLSGASTYTGATVVNAGTLSLTGSLTSNIEANSGATVTGTGSTTGSLTTNADSSLLAKTAGGVLTTSGGVNFAGATSLLFDDVLTSGTTYDVVNYGAGVLSNLSNLTHTFRGTVNNDVPNTKVTFTAGSSGTRTWNVTSGTWEIGGTDNNWLEDDMKFFNQDSVVFNNPASPSTVTLSGNLLPASVDVTNSTNGYVFSGSGSIGGSSSFSKSGSGTLEITTVNSYTGTTTINGGTLQVGSGAVAGSISSSSSIINDASLIFSSTEAQSYGNAISGTGTLTKAEAGILTLTGNNSYNGGATISAGTVKIGHINSFGSGTVDIGSVATVTNSANLSVAPGLANTFTGSGAFTAAAGSGLQVTLSGNWTAFTGTVSSSAGAGGDIVFNGAFSSGVSVTTSEDAAYVNNYNLNNSNGMIVQNLTGSTVTYKMGSYQSAVGSNLRNSGVATGSVIFEIGNLGTDTTVAGTIGGGAQSVSVTKVGAGTLTLEGLNTYTGGTTVTGGVLTITKDDVLHDSSTVTLATASSLNLTHSGADTVNKLFINSIEQANGLYTFGTGQLNVVGSTASTPFLTWAIAKGLDGTPGKENGPADDPDKDGATNLQEFAFNGDPLSGSDKGQVYVLTADSDADSPDTAKELILTLAVRKTTPAFTAGAPATAPLTDGINCSIHGSTDLASFGVTVTPVGFVDPGVALTDATNYEYRSFSLNGSNGLAGKGFLRAKVEAP